MAEKESFWDKQGFVPPTSNYFKFNEIGDNITGKVIDMKGETFPGDENPTPKLVLQVAGEEEPIEVTCGARNLKSLVIAERPELGDTVSITFTGRQNQTKLFDFITTRASGAGEDESSPLD